MVALILKLETTFQLYYHGN